MPQVGEQSKPGELKASGKPRSAHPVRDEAIWCICIFAIVFGSMIRFTNLDLKAVCIDEQVTARQIGGYPDDKIMPQAFDSYFPAGKLRDIPLAPNSTIYDTFEAVRLQTTFNPPIYFLLLRAWAELSGPHSGSLRLLSAIISLLQIPCFFLLGLELFASPLTAIIITALATISPYHLQLSQYARPYALWTVLTLLSSALLLRASRTGSRKLWIGYGFSALLDLYTHLSALRDLLCHLIYGCITKVTDREYKLSPLLWALVIALLLFVPWLLQMNDHLWTSCRGLNWFIGSSEINQLLTSWFRQTTEIFLDVDYVAADCQRAIAPLAFVSAAAAIVVFLRAAPKQARIFLLTLFGTTFLTLAVPDLLLGGNRTVETRYMMPCAVALQCMVGFAIAAICSSQRKLTSAIGMGLLVIAIASTSLSCYSVVQSKMQWHNWGGDAVQAGTVLNSCQRPILIGSQKHNRLLVSTLAHELRPDVMIAFSTNEKLLPLPDDATDVFIWEPTDSDIEQLSASSCFVKRFKRINSLGKVFRRAPAKSGLNIWPQSR